MSSCGCGRGGVGGRAALVAQGLRNTEIADRLFLAQKPVDDVSAILRKLEVPTRGHASAEAVRLGLAGQDR